MNILDKLQAKRTGNRGIGSFDYMPVCSSVDVRAMESSRPFMEEYVAEIIIGTVFTCNSAQYEHAFINAKKSLTRHLYEDIHIIIHDLRSALYAESSEEMNEAIGRLEECIK